MSDDARRSKTPDADPDGDPVVVLLLEDDETDRRRLAKFIRRAGLRAELHEAADLDGLVDRLQAQRFDLIYVDYHLGLATGHEALDIIFDSAKQKDAITVMVTSLGSPDIMASTIRSGCADYLLKEQIGPESLGKSLIGSLERLLLVSCIDPDDGRQDRLRRLMSRLEAGMSPSLRLMTCAMLHRTLKLCADAATPVTDARAAFERLCNDLIGSLECGAAATGVFEEGRAT